MSLLGRGKEIKLLEKELKKLQEDIEKLQKEEAEYRESISAILNEYDEEQKKLQEIEITYATEKQKQ